MRSDMIINIVYIDFFANLQIKNTTFVVYYKGIFFSFLGIIFIDITHKIINSNKFL